MKRKAADLIDSLSSTGHASSSSSSSAAREGSQEGPDAKKRKLGDKRKTFRARGWVYEDPAMELKRLEEDTVEKGSAGANAARIEELRAQLKESKGKGKGSRDSSQNDDQERLDPREERLRSSLGSNLS